MERYELRALMLATMLSTHSHKREILEEEMKAALKLVDQMLAATCPSCDGTGKFDTGMEPATRDKRPEDLVPCDHGTVTDLSPDDPEWQRRREANAKILNAVPCDRAAQLRATNSELAPPVLATQVSQAASADLTASLEQALEVKCKACNDTGKSSKGKPCICQQVKAANVTTEILPPKPDPAQVAANTEQVVEAPKELHAIYATEEYVCEKCDNANLEVELVVNKTPQTATYTCKDCGNKGDIVLETEDDYTDFVTSGKKIKAELPPPVKKTRAKKEAAPPTPPPVNDMPVVETAPNLLEQFKAPDVRPIVSAAPKLPPPTPAAVALAAQAQAAEQRVTGSLEVNIAEPPPVDVAAARESLKGMFGMMEDAQIIKEWETMTSKVFDAKTMTLDTLRSELMDRMIGLY